MCNDGVQLHMARRDLSLRRLRSVDDAELGHLGCCFAWGGKEMYKDLSNASAQQ